MTIPKTEDLIHKKTIYKIHDTLVSNIKKNLCQTQ